MAHEIIKENHPLNETPVWVTYPILTPLKYLSKDKKEQTKDQTEPLLGEESGKTKGKKEKKKKKTDKLSAAKAKKTKKVSKEEL